MSLCSTGRVVVASQFAVLRLKLERMFCAGLGTVRDAVGIVQDSGRAAADIAGLPHAEGDAEKLQKVSSDRLDL